MGFLLNHRKGSVNLDAFSNIRALEKLLLGLTYDQLQLLIWHTTLR